MPQVYNALQLGVDFEKMKRGGIFSKSFIYIGRPTIYGNPFEIGKDGTRKEVIEKYRQYAIHRMNTDDEFKQAIERLEGLNLVCWCAPKACHGDVLLELANSGLVKYIR